DLTKVHPMAALRTAISFLGVLDEEADDTDSEARMRKAIRLQAQVASIVTAFSRIRKGQEPVKPKKDLTYAENFLYMLNDKEPEAIEVEAIDKALVLHADHELNRSEEHTSELQSRFPYTTLFRSRMRKAIRLQAQVASIVTAFSRIRKGQEPVKPKKDLTYAENFLYMLNDKEPEAIEVEAIDKALVLHADHELN